MERGTPTATTTATDLPKSQVKRIIKSKLRELYKTDETYKSNIGLSKDASTAFSESGRVFISHLTSAANDVCRNSKRSTVTGDDILQALRLIDFEEFVQPLQSHLEEFRAGLKEKNRKKAETRQLNKAAAAENQKTVPENSEPQTQGIEPVEERKPEGGETKDNPPSIQAEQP